MFEATKFYLCKVCGNLVALMQEGGGTLVCCGQDMELLSANTTDAAQEKHVPVIKRDGNSVKVEVGSAEHPMIEEHYITWIAIEQYGRLQVAYLKPGEKPSAEFEVAEGSLTAYEYCNLHGLWKAEG